MGDSLSAPAWRWLVFHHLGLLTLRNQAKDKAVYSWHRVCGVPGEWALDASREVRR